MKLIHNQITDSIDSIRLSISKQIQSQVDNLVLTYVRVCINVGDFQEQWQQYGFENQCGLLEDAVRKHIQGQFLE
jgi:hypothetical protein